MTNTPESKTTKNKPSYKDLEEELEQTRKFLSVLGRMNNQLLELYMSGDGKFKKKR